MRKVLFGLGVAGLLVVVLLVWAQQAPVPASQVTIGGKVANVPLATLSGEPVELYTYSRQHGTLVIFVSTRCPVSNDYNQRMAELARDYIPREFAIIGVNSNSNEPANEVARHAAEKALGFTILKDPENRVADYLGASVTPEAYLFDRDWTLRYHGRIDNSRNPVNITSRDLRAALDAVEAGRPVPVAEAKAFGCTIKRAPRP